MDFRNGAVAARAQELVQAFHHLRFRILEGRIFRAHLSSLGILEVAQPPIVNRNDAVTVGGPCQRGCAEAVSAVVGEAFVSPGRSSPDGAHQGCNRPKAAV